MYRQRLGQNLTEDVIKSLNLKQQALDNLVNQTVLLAKAEEMGIRVSDEEVQAIIMLQPAFQRDGVFDPKRYEQLLRYQKMSPEEFEALQKKAIMVAKVQDIFRQGVKVSEKELQDLYTLPVGAGQRGALQASRQGLPGQGQRIKRRPREILQRSQRRVPDPCQGPGQDPHLRRRRLPEESGGHPRRRFAAPTRPTRAACPR